MGRSIRYQIHLTLLITDLKLVLYFDNAFSLSITKVTETITRLQYFNCLV